VGASADVDRLDERSGVIEKRVMRSSDSVRPSKKKASKSALPPNIREHILDRTIYLMGKMGTTDVSVRSIAQAAGVNLAAVNYYFTSKEQMLAQMADRFESGFKEVMRQLTSPGLLPEERLRRWASEVMRFLAEYPGILALMERQMAAEPRDAFGEALRSALERAVRQLRATLREVVDAQDEHRLAFKLTLFISTIAGPFPRSVDRGPERSGFRTPTQRARFLDLLLEHLRK
jgi:AcrR family transcriptional regulator